MTNDEYLQAKELRVLLDAKIKAHETQFAYEPDCPVPTDLQMAARMQSIRDEYRLSLAR